jgi:hypothetical protein
MLGKVIRRVMVGCLLLVVVSPLSAGLNRWTQAGIEGGSVSALAVAPSDPRIVYAATGGGVYRSATAGEPLWTRASEGLPGSGEGAIRALAVHPDDPDLVYAATFRSGFGEAGHGRLFGTEDGGVTWTEIGSGFSGAPRGIAVGHDRDLFLATSMGLFTTADGGESWVSNPAVGEDVRAVINAEGSIYAGGAAGIFASSDGGVRWQKTSFTGIAEALVWNPENRALYASAAGSGVYWSTSGGGEWHRMPGLSGRVTSLHVAGRGIHAVSGSYIYTYDANSSRWITTLLPENTRVVAVASVAAPRFYVGNEEGVFSGTGLSDTDWQPANRGMHAALGKSVLARGSDDAYAATASGLFHSRDGGGTWSNAAVAKPADLAAGGGTVYVATATGIRSSQDGGSTWSVVTPGKASWIGAASPSPATLYAAFQRELARSTDGGRNWRNISDSLDGGAYWFYYGFYGTTAVDPTDPDSVYVGAGEGLFRSVNGGTTWTRLLGQPGRWHEFSAVAMRAGIIQSALLCGGPSHSFNRSFGCGITTSLDGGKSWSPPELSEERVTSIVLDPIRPGVSYSGTASGRVYRSDDFGHQWGLFGEGLRGAPVARLAINEEGDRIYAATEGGVFTYQIAQSPDIVFEQLPDDPQRLPRLIGQLVEAVPADGDAGRLGPGLLLAVAGTVRGSGGTVFRTDVTLAHSGGTEQDVFVAWLPQGNAGGSLVPMYRITLPPRSDDEGGTLTLTDLADALGLEGLGSFLVVAVDGTGNVDGLAEIDGFARIRSVAGCGGGSVSQSLPAISSELFSRATRARVLGLRHEPSYRTNVGVVNLSDTTQQFTVIVNGELRSGRFNVTVPPFSSLQAAIPPGNYGAVAMTVISGGGLWTAYGSSVDNASGDAWAAVATPLRD